MKIKMRYEDAYQTLEVETKEIEKWLNISISEDESEEDYEKKSKKKLRLDTTGPTTIAGISMIAIQVLPYVKAKKELLR